MPKRYQEKPLNKIPVVYFSRVNVPENEQFSLDSAYNMVNPLVENKKAIKQSKRSNLKLFGNKMVLSKISWFSQRFDDTIPYQFVHSFYVFKSIYRYLVLALEDLSAFSANNIMPRCYVILKVYNIKNIPIICDAIENANRSSNIIRQEEPIQPISEPIQEAKIIAVEREHYPKKEERIIRQVSLTSSDNSSHKFKYYPTKQFTTRVFSRNNFSMENTGNSSQWREDVKFINYNPRKGNYVDDGGSVYLYSAQQVKPDYSKFYSSSLFSVSTSSSNSFNEHNNKPIQYKSYEANNRYKTQTSSQHYF